jgi:enterochelin esterase-like enzyme
LVAWLAVGIFGTWRYLDDYFVYRGFPPPVTPKGVPAGTVTTFQFLAPALREQSTALVYLPPGYARAVARGRRFGVMYLLHGSPGTAANLFDAGAVGRDANILIHAHRIKPVLLVAPFGLQGVGGDTEWANGRRGPYESYLRDVVHATDAAFATLAERGHRVIAGDSEGGFGAANVALRNLRLFGGFESWSGYFEAQLQGTFAGASPGTIAANSPAASVARRAREIRRVGLHAYLYDGAQERGAGVPMASFATELKNAGARVQSAVFPGGHDWALWRAQMPHMLIVASRWMEAAARSPRGGRHDAAQAFVDGTADRAAPLATRSRRALSRNPTQTRDQDDRRHDDHQCHQCRAYAQA